jgi:predicted nucleotidyltransferase component of viral defense system
MVFAPTRPSKSPCITVSAPCLNQNSPTDSAEEAFKGGTSLSKVHAGFYRLSEDLDFAISIPVTSRRSDRRGAITPIKEHLERIAERLPALVTSAALVGSHESRQYTASLQYESVVTGESETLKIEVAVREPVIESTVTCESQTLLRHPAPEIPTESEVPVRVLSLREAYAEKVRAALTRSPPAIRDIFDIADAVRASRIDLFESGFLDLVRQKLAVPGNAAIDTGRTRRQAIEDQLEANLKPVLRSSDYATFDLERAFADVERLAAIIQGG